MARNLDMNRLLNAADQRHFSHYSRLNDLEKKEFVYSIVLRWAHNISGPSRDAYLLRFNSRVNQYGELMWKYPDLAFAMMSSCGSGKPSRHEYVKAPKKCPDETILVDFFSIDWPGINQDEVDILLTQMDKNSFTQLVRDTGLEADQEKKILTAYGKHVAKK